MADVRDILINLLGRETVSGAAKKAADGVERLGDEMQDTARDAERLDGEIEQAERGLRDLAVQFARTSDAAERIDLTKAMRRQQAEIRKLSKARDLLPGKEIGADLAEQVSVSFIGRLGPLLARAPMGAMNPAVAAIGAPIAVGVASLVGTAIGGAIVGAVGVGGVVGGLALAGRDPQVKARAAEVGKDIGDVMGRSSASFVPVALQSLDTVRGRVRGMEDDFEAVFGAASRHVAPLLDGLFDAAENAMPGVIDAVRSAGPVIDSFGRGVARIGEALGDMLSDLSEYADEGARALNILFAAIDGGVRVTTKLLEGSAELFKWAEIVGAVMTGNAGKVLELANAERESAARAEEAAKAQKRLGEGYRNVGFDAATATEKIRGFYELMDESVGRVLDAEEANIRMAAAFRELKVAAKDGADKGINPNTEAGDRNRRALLEAARAANENAASIREITGDHKRAAAVTEQARREFLRAADAMGAEKAEALALATQLFRIPNVERSVKVNTSTARNQVAAYKRWLASVNLDKTSTVRQRIIAEQYTARGGVREFSHGGYVDGFGPKGVDSVPAMLAPGEGVLTAREVDSIGGPAGLERLRTLIRGGGRAAVPAMTAAGVGSGTVVHNTFHATFVVPPTAALADVGREVARALDAWAKQNNMVWRTSG